MTPVRVGPSVSVGSPVCIFSETCGRAVAMEHDGSVFACDRYAYPEYRLGNALTNNLGRVLERRVSYAMQAIGAPLMITRDSRPADKGTARRP